MTWYRTRCRWLLALVSLCGPMFGGHIEALAATGDKIAFARSTDQGRSWDICVMDADGATVRQLETPSGGRRPQWSADGASIYYVGSSWADGIWVIDAVGLNAQKISDEGVPFGALALSPGGGGSRSAPMNAAALC